MTNLYNTLRRIQIDRWFWINGIWWHRINFADIILRQPQTYKTTYVGDDGILPNISYRLDGYNNFVEAK